jgi:hypothetical protein
VTYDLRVEVQVHALYANDWHLSSATATTDGTFYQHQFGFNGPPNPAFFATFPELQFDSFWTVTHAYPNTFSEYGSLGFAVGPAVGPKTLTADWFETQVDEPGTYTIARFTVINGTKLQVTGSSMGLQLGRVVPFDLLVTLSSCKWDLNGDGKVCQEDLGQLLSQYGTFYGQSDLGELLAQYDGGCGDPCD